MPSLLLDFSGPLDGNTGGSSSEAIFARRSAAARAQGPSLDTCLDAVTRARSFARSHRPDVSPTTPHCGASLSARFNVVSGVSPISAMLRRAWSFSRSSMSKSSRPPGISYR